MQDDSHLLRDANGDDLDAQGLGADGRRKRPKPGERRGQILQALASMLEQPGCERIKSVFREIHLQLRQNAAEKAAAAVIACLPTTALHVDALAVAG